LRARESFQQLEQGIADLVEAAVREVNFGLHTKHVEHATVPDSIGQVVEERGLPHAGVPSHDADRTAPLAGIGNEAIKGEALFTSSQKCGRIVGGFTHGSPPVASDG
jgi:hypothetical protein